MFPATRGVEGESKTRWARDASEGKVETSGIDADVADEDGKGDAIGAGDAVATDAEDATERIACEDGAADDADEAAADGIEEVNDTAKDDDATEFVAGFGHCRQWWAVSPHLIHGKF